MAALGSTPKALPSNDIDLAFFFKVLLAGVPEAKKAKFQESEHDFILKGVSPSVALALQAILSSTKAFRKALPSSLTKILPEQKESKRVTPQETKQVPLTAPETKASAEKILRNMYSAESWKKGNLATIFSEAVFVDGQLVSAETFSEPEAAVWEAQLNYLISHLANLSRDEIARAYSGQKALPQPARNIQHNTLTSVIQECFYLEKIINKETGEFYSARVHFAAKKLCQTLVPPIISQAAHAEDKERVDLHINKKHFMTFLPHLAEGNVLFNVTNEVATPIWFAPERLVEKPNIIFLELDCSGSLKPVFPSLIKNIEEFCDTMATLLDPKKTQICFCPFHSKPGKPAPRATFSIEDKKKIGAYLEELKAGGATAILDTMQQVHNYINEKGLQRTHNVMSILFTDGRDNCFGLKEEDPECEYKEETVPPVVKKEFDRAKKLEKEERFARPKFFIMYLGNKVNLPLLKSIAKEFDGQCFQLHDVEDFQRIFDHANEIKFERQLLKIVGERIKNPEEMYVLRSNSPQALHQVKIPLAPGAKVKLIINGVHYELQSQDPSLQLAAPAEIPAEQDGSAPPTELDDSLNELDLDKQAEKWREEADREELARLQQEQAQEVALLKQKLEALEKERQEEREKNLAAKAGEEKEKAEAQEQQRQELERLKQAQLQREQKLAEQERAMKAATQGLLDETAALKRKLAAAEREMQEEREKAGKLAREFDLLKAKILALEAREASIEAGSHIPLRLGAEAVAQGAGFHAPVNTLGRETSQPSVEVKETAKAEASDKESNKGATDPKWCLVM